jgi:hypothetical protein
MTSDKRHKARIRARMARTGERYTTARRHVMGAAAAPTSTLGYTLRGGLHPDAATVANVLANGGVTRSDGVPLTEAMVFGVMGGLGAGYILWEFERDDSRVVTLGFRSQWQYFDRGVRTALERLDVPHEERTTTGARSAARHLDVQLGTGRPAIVWPDHHLIGYWQLPAGLDGHGGHPVVVVGAEHDVVHLDDRTDAVLTVSRDVLDRARGRIGSYRNTLVDPRPHAGPIAPDRLRSAALDGIDQCLRQLRGSSTSFALPAWRKWGRLMTDPGHAKGWPSVFADRVGLCGALLSVWEGTSELGMSGGNLRGLYGAFLREAAPLLGIRVDAVTAELDRAADLWTRLGDVAIGDDPALARLRDLTVTIRQALAADGDAGAAEALAAGVDLWELRTAVDAECPLEDDDIVARFAAMGGLLADIHDTEVRALDALAAARDEVA